ncbi:hypothetical protein MalM25_00840 [Planctomycetes bacterium MalM25]|nr:hypothetical protein MalM25_00840 [Planctomycetes bacterium MalM25]
MRALKIAVGTALWGSALWASTQMHRVELPFEHGLCGPWGCAAAPEALLGAHLLWLTLLAPTLVLTCRAVGPSRSRRLANAAWKIGALLAGGIVLWGIIAWLRAGEPQEYALKRGLFLLATTPDLPAIPLAISGLVARFANKRVGSHKPAKQPVDSEGFEGETEGV